MNHFPLNSHRINKLIQQLDAKLSREENNINTRWDSPVNDPKNTFWHQDKSSYLFALGCTLILIAIFPGTHATAINNPLALGQTADNLASKKTLQFSSPLCHRQNHYPFFAKFRLFKNSEQ
jgi:hypothetical protein